MALGSNRFIVGIGEHIWSDRTILTGGSVSGNQVTGLSGLTANKYDGVRMRVLNGTNAGKLFHVVTNGTTSLTFQEAATGFAATDYVVFELRFAAPSVRNIFIDLPEDFDMYTASAELDEAYAHGAGRDRNFAQTKKFLYEAALPIILQNPRLLFLALGEEKTTGTDKTPSGGGSTLANATYIGETIINVASAANYAQGDFIQVDVAAGDPPTSAEVPEVRQITNVNVNAITLDYPLRFAHANGVACNEVIAPFTHYLAPASELPYFDVIGVYNEATVHVRDAVGVKANRLELTSNEDDVVRVSVDTVALKVLPTGSAPSVTLVTTKAYHFSQVSSGISVNSVVYANIKAFTYTLEHNQNQVYAHQDTSGKSPFFTAEGRRRHELQMILVPFNTNIYDLLTGETEHTVTLTFVRTAATDTLTLTFTVCRISQAPHGMPADGPVNVNITAHPQAMTAKVIDSISSYPAGA
jgi:hypothetical protein